jgi:hypothetical protein
MNSRMFRSFVKTAMELQADQDTPGDYAMVKAAVAAKFPKLAMGEGMPGQVPPQQSRYRKFTDAAKAEAGPAAGAVVGAGIANMYNVNPLAGAAAGYGIGAIPEIIHGIRHRA